MKKKIIKLENITANKTNLGGKYLRKQVAILIVNLHLQLVIRILLQIRQIVHGKIVKNKNVFRKDKFSYKKGKLEQFKLPK